jgi:hypothetical protein
MIIRLRATVKLRFSPRINGLYDSQPSSPPQLRPHAAKNQH